MGTAKRDLPPGQPLFVCGAPTPHAVLEQIRLGFDVIESRCGHNHPPPPPTRSAAQRAACWDAVPTNGGGVGGITADAEARCTSVGAQWAVSWFAAAKHL